MEVDLTAFLAPIRTAMVGAAYKASKFRLKNPQICCRPRCIGCCTRYITVSLAEAAVIMMYLKDHSKWSEVEKRAEDLQRTVMLASPEAWFKMGIPCPVLSVDGLCEAYMVRPVTCSAHFVEFSPEACGADSTSRASYAGKDYPEAYLDFIKAFDATIGPSSYFRVMAPMPLALLFAKKVAYKKIEDLDALVKVLAKESPKNG